MANKVRFGLKNCYYAPITTTGSVDTYGTPVKLPGAKALSVEHDSSDSTKFYADDTAFYVDSTGGGSQTGELEIADLSDAAQKALFGYAEDTNKLILETDSATAPRVALLFECQGDTAPRRYAYYNVTCKRPDFTANSKGETTEPDTLKVKFTATSEPFTIDSVETYVSMAHIVKGADTQDKAYNKWFDEVIKPGATITTFEPAKASK